MLYLPSISLYQICTHSIVHYHLIKEHSLSQSTGLPNPFPSPFWDILTFGIIPTDISAFMLVLKNKTQQYTGEWTGLVSSSEYPHTSSWVSVQGHALFYSVTLQLNFVPLSSLLVTRSCPVSLQLRCGTRALMFHA